MQPKQEYTVFIQNQSFKPDTHLRVIQVWVYRCMACPKFMQNTVLSLFFWENGPYFQQIINRWGKKYKKQNTTLNKTLHLSKPFRGSFHPWAKSQFGSHSMQALHKLVSLLIILLAFQLPKSVPAHLSNSINCPFQIQGSLFAFNCTRLLVQKWHNHILTAGVFRVKEI